MKLSVWMDVRHAPCRKVGVRLPLPSPATAEVLLSAGRRSSGDSRKISGSDVDPLLLGRRSASLVRGRHPDAAIPRVSGRPLGFPPKVQKSQEFKSDKARGRPWSTFKPPPPPPQLGLAGSSHNQVDQPASGQESGNSVKR